MKNHVTCIWQSTMDLGEGPIWDHKRNVLWFVDIKQQKLHRLAPDDGRVTSWPAPADIGWVIPAADGSLLAGLQTGLASFDISSGTFHHLVAVESHLPGNRLNDAAVGPDGIVWFGSMDDAHQQASGHFYKYDGIEVANVAISPVPITNGPAISPDGRTIYRVDTVGGKIYAAQIDADGKLGKSHDFATIDPADGSPDGVTVDSAGNVWLAVWGGWCVRCYSPGGTLLETVRLPVANVTKLAFGGSDFLTAYVTTARGGLSADELLQQPLAGSLFAFQTDIPGLRQALALSGN
jgi:xylono-1,5-lactonase